jgi:hypothetical protein
MVVFLDMLWPIEPLFVQPRLVWRLNSVRSVPIVTVVHALDAIRTPFSPLSPLIRRLWSLVISFTQAMLTRLCPLGHHQPSIQLALT